LTTTLLKEVLDPLHPEEKITGNDAVALPVLQGAVSHKPGFILASVAD
jgi:hypothetical protein